MKQKCMNRKIICKAIVVKRKIIMEEKINQNDCSKI